MQVYIEKGIAKGNINAEPSKSMSHRILICASLSDGKSKIENISICDDVLATIDCLRALGAEIELDGCNASVLGISKDRFKSNKNLFCNESASTLRFLIPLCLIDGKVRRFVLSPSLSKRPLTVYERLFGDEKIRFSNDRKNICINGVIKNGNYEIEGDISSQFISGLLFALPMCNGNSTIKIFKPIESKSYIDLTLQSLHAFGIDANFVSDDTIYIKGNQKYSSTDLKIEGDYSSASVFVALSKLEGNVKISGLCENSLQGDKICYQYLSTLSNEKAHLSLKNSIDLAPILFAFAAVNHGGVFNDINRLRFKESDRLTAMTKELSKFGIKSIIYDNCVEIISGNFHRPNEMLDSHNDHRIVMALSFLLTITGGSINGAEAVNKSYPNFFNDLEKVGIKLNIIGK